MNAINQVIAQVSAHLSNVAGLLIVFAKACLALFLAVTLWKYVSFNAQLAKPPGAQELAYLAGVVWLISR